MRGKANKLFRNNRLISLSKAGLADLNRRQGGGGRGGKEMKTLNKGGDRRGQKVRGWERA